MYLVFKDKKIFLRECNSFFSRLRGFMFFKDIDHALLFKRCNSIHTFFMRRNIDVIFCDKDNNVLYYYNNLGANKIILPKKGVFCVYEIPVNYFDLKVNDRLEIEI